MAPAWFGSAWLSIWFTAQEKGFAAVWPSNAILLFALLVSRTARWPWLVLSTVVASILTSMIVGHHGLMAVGFGTANVAEATLAAVILRASGFRERLLSRFRGVLWFTLSCTIACGVSAAFGAIALKWHADGSGLHAWLIWFAPDTLGYLIFTPVLLIGRELFGRLRGSFHARREWIEAPLALGAVALTCTLAFRQHAYPLLFLIYLPVLVTTYRLRAPGAAASVLIVTIIGLWNTARGEGPTMMIVGSPEIRMFFFQFYAAFLFLGTLPVATLLADLDALAEAKRDAEAKLRAAAEQAAEAADRAAHEARMLAATDELTGLANRREFLRRLAEAVDQARAGTQLLALALFDIDHFKKVNDCFGHAGGDTVLRNVALVAVGAVRTGDLVGRIGGEEFAVLMPLAGPDDAGAISERLRKRIEWLRSENDVGVTVSIGVAAFSPDMSEDDLINRADEALYAAKHAGRNILRHAA